jgi:hypothetical protein
MARSDRVGGLSPRAWGLASCLAALLGLAGVGVSVATGSVPLLVLAYAMIFGAGLIPSLVDLHHAKAQGQPQKTQADRPQLYGGRDIRQETGAGRLVWIEPEQPRPH